MPQNQLQPGDIMLPSNLSEQAKLFALLYNPSAGGYHAPAAVHMPRLTAENVCEIYHSIAPEHQLWDSVELEVAQFLHSLVKLTSARLVLETGCHRGFSTCFLAAGVADHEGGKVITIDPLAVPHLWDGSDLSRTIEWLPQISTACVELVDASLGGRQFDLLFLDSLHTYSNLIAEISLYERRLKDGGVIVLHDTMFFDCLGAVVAQMSRNPRYEIVNLPSPRNHGRNTRKPGITIMTKLNSRYDEYPVVPVPEYVETFGNAEVVNLAGRNDLDPSLIEMARGKPFHTVI